MNSKIRRLRLELEAVIRTLAPNPVVISRMPAKAN